MSQRSTPNAAGIRLIREQVGASDPSLSVELIDSASNIFLKNASEVTLSEWLLAQSFKITLPGVNQEPFTVGLSELLSMSLFQRLCDHTGVIQRVRKFDCKDAFRALVALMSHRNRSSNDLLLKSVYTHSYQLCNARNFGGRLNSEEMEEAIRLYDSIVMKALYALQLKMFHTFVSQDSRVRLWQKILKKTGLSDIVAFDGYMNQVTPSSSDYAKVDGSGSHRKKRKRGHRKHNTSSKNFHLKNHLLVSAILKALIYSDVTEGTEAEYRHMHCDVLAALGGKYGQALFIADRASAATKQIKKFKKWRIPFAIRCRHNSAWKIRRAWDKDGKLLDLPQKTDDKGVELPLLLNDDYLKETVNRDGILDLIVSINVYMDKATATPDEIAMCEPPSRKNQKQLLLRAGIHRVVMIRGDKKPDGTYEQPLTVITNLPRERISAEDIATLYKTRWEIETIIKALKQGNSAQSTHTKKVSFALETSYVSHVLYSVKALFSNVGSDTGDSPDPMEQIKHIYAYHQSAVAGIARREYEVERVMHCIYNRFKGVSAVRTCNLKAITKDGEFKAEYSPKLNKIVSQAFCNKLNKAFKDESNPSLHIFSGKWKDVQQHVRNAIVNPDSDSAKMIECLNEHLSKCGIACDLPTVFAEIRAKAQSIEVDTELAITRPAEISSRSMLQIQCSTKLSMLVCGLYDFKHESKTQTSNQNDMLLAGRPLDEVLGDAIRTIERNCHSAHICLRSYEQGNDYRILLASHIAKAA